MQLNSRGGAGVARLQHHVGQGGIQLQQAWNNHTLDWHNSRGTIIPSTGTTVVEQSYFRLAQQSWNNHTLDWHNNIL